FKAQWQWAFPEGATQERPFTVASGKDVSAKAMSLTRSLRYGETADAEMLEIPYRDRATSMVVILPKAKGGLDELIHGLTSERLKSYVSKVEYIQYALQLPTFAILFAGRVVAPTAN